MIRPREAPPTLLAPLALALALVLAPGEARAGKEPPPPPDCGVELERLEKTLGALPDDLRAANDYRRKVIACAAYDRSIELFGKLTEAHPRSPNLVLNYGYAYVDKIPAAGSITQVILANTALGLFSRAIELEPSWLAFYTRGNSYLFWPTVFGRAPLGVADLERAVELGKKEGNLPYHVRAWVALGDGYWKVGDLAKARKTWEEAMRLFPSDPRFPARLGKQGDELAALIDADYDPNTRVDTDTSVMWATP
jgi:tetratricopeptide (TPR) repeat protein